ncbi:1994_t:CDS:2 [Paraglomus brasilianum]|uniref:1994_t:CDS:1 n=1 Tax=Paraglomus brasilianum TaxID=144538 RepID=A0A9N9DLJ9_9GLOM|nr:1994_t:CDS:2 [Paraglomus brasilianum]
MRKNRCFWKKCQPVPAQLLTGAENYGRVLGNAFADLDKQFAELVNVYRTKIGVDPTDDTLATDAAGNNILVDATITTNATYNLNGKTLAQLLTPHTCPPCPQTHCPNTHANYDAIKGESAEYQRIHTKLSGLTTERERALEAVITEIKSKLTPPACDKCPGKDSKISELQEQITNLKAPKTLKDLPISKGVKEEVIKISQELGLTAQSCAKLEKATSYQELSSLQKQAFQEKLDKEIGSKNSANYLN